MVIRHLCGSTTWIDLECPTKEELKQVMEEYGISSRVEDEIVNPTPYPLSVSFPAYSYLILHFPVADTHEGTRSQEIDFIVGKNFLITVRYETIAPVHNLHKIFEAEELLDLPAPERASGAELTELVFRRLYRAIREEVEQTARLLEHIEQDVFSGKERETVRKISDAGRVLLRFETVLRRHEEPLTMFLAELGDKRFFGPAFKVHATSIEAEREHVAALVVSYRAVVRELRTTNDSLLSSSQNEVMKYLAFMSLLTFPLTLIAAIFAMETDYLPIVGLPHDFWIVIGIMVLVGGGLFLFARAKRWL